MTCQVDATKVKPLAAFHTLRRALPDMRMQQSMCCSYYSLAERLPYQSPFGPCADYLMVMPLEEDNLHGALHERKWQPSTQQLVDLALRLAEACAHVHSKGEHHFCNPWPSCSIMCMMSKVNRP